MCCLAGRSVESFIQEPAAKRRRRDRNIISIKLQSEALKKPLSIDVDKNKKFAGIIFKVSEALKCKPENLSLHFDGETIELGSTPAELDFDGGEIIDCIMKK